MSSYVRPLPPLRYSPHQLAFLRALRTWRCANGHLYERIAPDVPCTSCGAPPRFHAYHRLMLLAGRRSGKTRLGALGILNEIAIPHTIAWVVTPTYQDLHDFIWPAILSQIPREWLANPKDPLHETHQEVRLKNGSIIQGRSADKPNRLRGQGIKVLWLDEAAFQSPKTWDVISPSLAESKGITIVTTTPAGFDWTYDAFETRAYAKEPGYWFTTYPTIANPLFAFDPQLRAEVEHERRTKPADMFAQEYEATRLVHSGMIFGRIPSALVIDDETEAGKAWIKSVIPHWPHLGATSPAVVGIDPGASTEHPYAATVALATPKGYVFCGEYLERSPRSNEFHALGLQRLVRGPTEIRWGIDKRRKTDQMELARHGIIATQVGDEVAPEIARMRGLVEHQQIYFIKSRTVELRRQWEAYRYVETEKADGSVAAQPKIYKRDDDLVDAARYLIDIAPPLPEAPAKPTGRDLEADPVPEECRYSWEREQRADGKLPPLRPPEDEIETPLYEPERDIEAEDAFFRW